MEERVNLAKVKFDNYVDTFLDISPEQRENLEIKREHSIRVANITLALAKQLNLAEFDLYLAYLTGLYHDIGRFKQLKEYNTFNDAKSVDHAEYSVEVLQNDSFLEDLNEDQERRILKAIRFHNKREIPTGLSEEEQLFAKLIRDADKLDILKVLTDYYTDPKAKPNHTLTWEMPKGIGISADVARQILKGVLVSKEKVENELDIKVMQLSWVYDLNYKPSFEHVMKNRFLEKIYNSMPKNDTVIEIYRKVKVFSENKFVV